MSRSLAWRTLQPKNLAFAGSLMSKATLSKRICRTWSLLSTCFACLEPGRASCGLGLKSLQCSPMVTLTIWVYVAITTVPLERVGAVVLHQLIDAWC